ncbi:MAG TPA: tyrosine-type recombinase/integrase [Pirellulaceae bacterium]|jgi:integrase|nr:tyrosine-type recombinase/integrase [Pirellulaceae bacterium]
MRVKVHLEAGRTPPPKEAPDDDERLTVKRLANTFLTHKKSAVEIGELTDRSFRDYLKTCEGMADAMGKETPVELIKAEDLLAYRRSLANRLGPVALGNEVNRCRVVFNFAFQNGLIDKPVRFGDFKRPGKPALRKARAEKGSRLFDPAELQQIIKAADVQLKAMILLAINCGFGNSDCGQLPIEAVDLDGAWIDFPRPKTGVPRRCKLWPETVDALRAWLVKRKKPADDKHAGLMFVTTFGASWHNDLTSGSPVGNEFRKLLDELELYRPGLSFYALRHSFQTIGDDTGDYLAVRRIMGHADSSISGHYRERFDDAKLIRVSEHIRGWLFGQETK